MLTKAIKFIRTISTIIISITMPSFFYTCSFFAGKLIFTTAYKKVEALFKNKWPRLQICITYSNIIKTLSKNLLKIFLKNVLKNLLKSLFKTLLKTLLKTLFKLCSKIFENFSSISPYFNKFEVWPTLRTVSQAHGKKFDYFWIKIF